MPKKYEIAVIPGDGTGPEVVREGRKVLDALSRKTHLELVFEEFDLGGEAYLKTGALLPGEIIEKLGSKDAIYLGAIGDPGVRPGILEREILLKLRFELDLYINLRPVVLLPGVHTPLKGKGPEDVDFVVVRENSEGLYAGGGAAFKRGTPDEVAVQQSINTRKGVERCLRYAFEFCIKRGKQKKLTLCGKNNVLTYEGDLWDRVFQELEAEFPSVATAYQNVDALCMWMLKNPEYLDVVVTNNMFGDIITDLGAMLQGGLGIAAGGNINPSGTAMFEPIGGSAPKYAGRNQINPLAAVSAAKMMLEHLGEAEAGGLLQRAVERVVMEDLKSLDAGKMGYSTSEVGDLVVSYL